MNLESAKLLSCVLLNVLGEYEPKFENIRSTSLENSFKAFPNSTLCLSKSFLEKEYCLLITRYIEISKTSLKSLFLRLLILFSDIVYHLFLIIYQKV